MKIYVQYVRNLWNKSAYKLQSHNHNKAGYNKAQKPIQRKTRQNWCHDEVDDLCEKDTSPTPVVLHRCVCTAQCRQQQKQIPLQLVIPEVDVQEGKTLRGNSRRRLLHFITLLTKVACNPQGRLHKWSWWPGDLEHEGAGAEIEDIWLPIEGRKVSDRW